MSPPDFKQSERRLDCETSKRTLDSLSRILGRAADEVRERLASFRYTMWRELSLPEAVMRLGLGVEPEESFLIDDVAWFHGTRVPRGTSFAEGLLTLSEARDRVWELLRKLSGASEGEWLEFQENMRGQGARQYYWKRSSGTDEGPDGMLVREILVRPLQLNHDYLGVPEIVEDICLSHAETFGPGLLERYRAATTPCIVKFVSSRRTYGVVPAAATYLWASLNGEEHGIDSNTCFDGEGQRVEPRDILAVSFMDDEELGASRDRPF